MSRRGTAGGRGSQAGPKPAKICPACGRPFSWRRRWAACWEQVRYCSDRCRGRGVRDRATTP